MPRLTPQHTRTRAHTQEYDALQKEQFSLQERLDHMGTDDQGILKLQQRLSEVDARMHELEEEGLSDDEN